MALLTITSRHASCPSTNSLVMHCSKVIARLCPAPLRHELEFGHGTRITVTDLFGNMPVRVKHRAVSLQKSEDLDREWDDLKRMVTGLLLAFKERVRVAVFDAEGSRRFLIRGHSHRSNSDPKDGQTLVLDQTLAILSQAWYIKPHDFGSWVLASARTSDVAVQSAISLRPSPTKQVQSISFGILPLDFTYASFLYSSINRLFSMSNFGTEDAEGAPDALGEKKYKTQAKGVNKWPMFVVWIEPKIPITEINNDPLGPGTSLQRILDVVSAMFRRFLEQHYFSRPKIKSSEKSVRIMSPSPSLSVKAPVTRSPSCIPALPNSNTEITKNIRPQGATGEFSSSRISVPGLSGGSLTARELQQRDFGSWSRVKSARSGFFDEVCSGIRHGGKLPARPSQHPSNDSVSPQLEHFRPLSAQSDFLVTQEGDRDSFSTKRLRDPDNSHTQGDMGDNSVDETMRWIDPITKKIILINKRTGQTLFRATASSSSFHPNNSDPLLHLSRRPSLIGEAKQGSSPKPSVWLDAIFKEWDNPVFPLTERPVSSATLEFSNKHPSCCMPRGHNSASSDSLGLGFNPSSNIFNGRVTKNGLRNARVISQVDKKFILIKMVTEGGEILVLVDQHAADERYRIEMLFDQLCGSSESCSANAISLAKPISFSVPSQEARLFKSRSGYFASWGCSYNIDKDSKGSSSIQVTKLPVLIAERCRLEPRLAIDMLRSELWAQHDDEIKRSLAQIRTEKPTESWLECIGDCPKGIIDLLNSRACRTAIMFNDALTHEECMVFISQLATCAFPFQCAHGRPTMVPIVNLPSTDTTLFGDSGLDNAFSAMIDRRANFLRAFETWETQLPND